MRLRLGQTYRGNDCGALPDFRRLDRGYQSSARSQAIAWQYDRPGHGSIAAYRC